MTQVPSYADLPNIDGVRHSWGLWGADDRLGALNLLSPETARRGMASVRRAEVFSLNLSMTLPDPPLFARPELEHELRTSANGSINDVLSAWNTQNSSQWDGFRHVMWHGHGNYNGVSGEEHGVHHWSRRPIVTRAILVDVGRWRAAQGRPLRCDAPDLIEVADLDGALRSTGVTVEPGDILLIRTGWLEWYLTQDAGMREKMSTFEDLVAPGLVGREEMAEYLWDLHVAGVAADNPSLEPWPQGMHLSEEHRAAVRADPSRRHEAALHVRLLTGLGVPIGELWDLTELAEDCEADRTYAMLLTSAPHNLPYGAASPANAIAIR